MLSGPIARWSALPGNVRGALWLLASAAGFSAMNALVKALGQELPPYQLVFFRTGFGLLALLPFLLRTGLSELRPVRPAMHLLRGLLGLAALFATFYALTALPLATAVAIFFAKPLFTIVLAVPVLGERVGWRRGSAAAAGFVGVLIMLRPWEGAAFDPAMLVALAGALLMATVMIVIKKMTASERPLAMLFYFTLIGMLGSLPPALAEWRTPDAAQLVLLLAMGGIASLSQYFLVRAYRAGEAAAISPMDYVQLVFAAAVGFLWFGEVPDAATACGAAIIAASSLYIVRREARLARRSIIAKR